MVRGSRLNAGLFAGAAAAALLVAPASKAQAQVAAKLSAAATDANAASAANALADQASEVIVTAQKRENRVSDVPISIGVISSKQIEQQGLQDVDDLVRELPNVTLQTTEIGASFLAIRGVYSDFGLPTVGVYIDETPVQAYQRGFTGNPDPRLFDLDRIEVLRGPQGTLFGASSLGGTLRYITTQPSLTKFSGRVEVEGADTDGGAPSYQFAGAVGGPIVQDTLGFRASAYYRRDGGYIDKDNFFTGAPAAKNVNGDDTLALRAALKYSAGEHFDATLSVMYQSGRIDDLPVYEQPGEAYPQTPPSFKQNFQVPQRGRDNFVLPSLTLHGYLDGVTLTSVTSVFTRHNVQASDYSTLPTELILIPILGPSVTGQEEVGGTTNVSSTRQNNVTQEIRISNSDPGARLQWTVGAFYQHSEFRLDQSDTDPGLDAEFESLLGGTVGDITGIPLLPGAISYVGSERYNDDELAGFGEASLKVTKMIELVAGVRVSRSRTLSQVNANGLFNGGPTPAANAVAFKDNETPVTPRFGLNIRPMEHTLFYASASEGFRPGGGNLPVPASACATDLHALGLTQAPSTYKSDTVWNYEGGYKGDITPTLSVAATVFQIDWNNIQQSVNLPDCGFLFTGNLGSARNRGVEFEVNFRPIPSLRLNGAFGYVDARYLDTVSVGPGAIVAGKGDRVPYTPDWTASGSAEYRFSLGQLPAYIRGDFQYRGDLVRDSDGALVASDPFLYRQKAYEDVSMRFGVMLRRWEVALYATNLLNSAAIINRTGDDYPVSGLRVRDISLRPRTVGVTLSQDF